MKFHTTEAPTRLMAIGRKMMVFTRFSAVGFSRSARTATASPMTTVAAGTIRSQRNVLKSVSRKSGELSSSV